jgi:hypothetical protein
MNTRRKQRTGIMDLTFGTWNVQTTESYMQQDEEEDQKWDGWMTCPIPEKDGNKWMERQSKGPRDLEV